MMIPVLLVLGATGLVLLVEKLNPGADRFMVGRSPTLYGGDAIGFSEDPLYRVIVRVPPEYVSSIRRTFGELGQKTLLKSVRGRVEKMGFRDSLLAMQDPTDNTLVAVLARRNHGRTQTGLDPYVRIVRTEVVDEPSVEVEQATKSTLLDPGLGTDEVAAVRYALVREGNPRHLAGFASSFEPYFPCAASLLRTKALLLELRATQNRRRLFEACERTSSGRNIFAPKTLDLLQEATPSGWSDVQNVWRGLVPQALREPLPPTWTIPSAPTRTGLYSYLCGCSKTTNTPLVLLKDEAKRAACFDLKKSYEILQGRSSQRPSANPAVEETGSGLVDDLGYGIKIVRPDVLRSILPEDGQEGFVSPSALQLSLSTAKPGYAGVRNASRIGRILDQLQDKTDGVPTCDSKTSTPAAPPTPKVLSYPEIRILRARSQMERANRAIERRRWITWYERAREVFA